MLALANMKKSLFSLVLLLPAISFAEPMTIPEYDAGLSLNTLTQKVYERLPGKSAESSFSQMQKANEDMAGALFAEPAAANLVHYNDTVGTNNGMQEWDGSIDLPLWLPGQKQAQKVLANKIADQLPAYQQQLMLMASGEVRTLIWDVKAAETMVEDAQLVWQTAQKLEQDVIARVKAGDLPQTERLLASSNTMEAYSKLVAAQSDLETKLNTYQFKTGEQTLPGTLSESLSTTNDITESHPLLKMQDQYISMLMAKQEMAGFDGALNPNLSVGMRHDRGNSNESFNNSLSVGVSIPFNNSRYRKPAIAEAAAAVTEAQVQRQQLLRELKTQALVKQKNLKSKQTQLALLTEQDKTTQVYYDLQKRAFDLGEINLMSLLRSQLLANESHSRKRLLQVEIERKIAELNQSLGVVL